LLTPILVPLARNHWKALLLLSAFIHVGLFALRYVSLLGLGLSPEARLLALMPRWFFVAEPLWFILGLVCALHSARLGPVLRRYQQALVAATVCLGVLAVLEYHWADSLVGEDWIGPMSSGVARLLFCPALILAVLASDRVPVPLARPLQVLGTKSLGVYLGNIPAIYVVALLLYHFAPALLGQQILYWAILALAGLGTPILVMDVFRRVEHRLPTGGSLRLRYRYLFGAN
jgi:surface polysaccharide O-acyltransferase-like enzyme